MILSNLSSSVDVESRAMTTMGDTLGRSGAGAGPEVGERRTLVCGSRCRGTEGRSRRLRGVFRPRVLIPGRTRRHWPRPALCLLSFERSLRCCALLLPHGPGRVRGLYEENRKTGFNWIESQVRNIAVSVSCRRKAPSFSPPRDGGRPGSGCRLCPVV